MVYPHNYQSENEINSKDVNLNYFVISDVIPTSNSLNLGDSINVSVKSFDSLSLLDSQSFPLIGKFSDISQVIPLSSEFQVDSKSVNVKGNDIRDFLSSEIPINSDSFKIQPQGINLLSETEVNQISLETKGVNISQILPSLPEFISEAKSVNIQPFNIIDFTDLGMPIVLDSLNIKPKTINLISETNVNQISGISKGMKISDILPSLPEYPTESKSVNIKGNNLAEISLLGMNLVINSHNVVPSQSDFQNIDSKGTLNVKPTVISITLIS